MKRSLVLVLLLWGSRAMGQNYGACCNAMAINKYGQPTGGAKVEVCSDAACAQSLPTIYADSGLTQQKPNPFGADADGNYTWCAMGGSHFFEQVTYGSSVKTLDVTLPVTKAYVDNAAPNLASPPALGSTTPNVVNATQLNFQNIPGVAYLVSHYAGIQDAINAAYGSGVVSGKVIDDRTSAYTGAGFYIPDSVTVQLAPVPYQFTSTVTHNNGHNDVSAAILVEQGAHVIGGGTSSNHGTTITVASGWANDIVATTSVGTGISQGTVQWWHWGSIENLNIDGANQAAGECVHVENMGETSRVRDLLVKNCYSNNIDFVGASATESDVSNISTMKSRNGSGVRFTNLAGMGKIVGLSGDCNYGSLVSVQENAAGTLTILGLKSEDKSTVCSNGAAHDPVILLDSMASQNTHVRVVGGYAFGTAQSNFAKVVGSGGGILEMEGVYLTGYTNLMNDTIRSVVIPSTQSNSKQPFYYEPNGMMFGNQALNFTPGTGIMATLFNGSITPIFYQTTSNATMLADTGNGDNQTIIAGGVQFAGHNRTQFGQTPEAMARAGYRWLGVNLGYDTTKWDFVPAWKASDTTEKNIGSPLMVCRISDATRSCRWDNIFAVNLDVTTLTLNGNVVAPSSTTPNMDGVGAPGTSNTLGQACTPDVHLVSGTMIGTSGAITGNGSYQTVFSFTLPAGTFAVGKGVSCYARWVHGTGSSAVSFQWKLGGTAYTAQSVTSSAGPTNIGRSEIEIYNPSSLNAQNAVTLPLQQGGATPVTGHVDTSAENLANTSTLTFSFNVANTDAVTPIAAYCSSIQ